MSDFANLLQDLVRVSDNREVRHETWGFTIYRTVYTGSQDDQRWDMLIDAITSSVYNAIMTNPEGTSGSNNKGRAITMVSIRPRPKSQFNAEGP